MDEDRILERSLVRIDVVPRLIGRCAIEGRMRTEGIVGEAKSCKQRSKRLLISEGKGFQYFLERSKQATVLNTGGTVELAEGASGDLILVAGNDIELATSQI
jgi:hypothetical protein